jgi:hypothetical protein
MSNLESGIYRVPPNALGWSSVATEAPKSKTVLALFVAVRAEGSNDVSHPTECRLTVLYCG